jgi:outer membrane protein OmpA-like peptidoglycan-associated protein
MKLAKLVVIAAMAAVVPGLCRADDANVRFMLDQLKPGAVRGLPRPGSAAPETVTQPTAVSPSAARPRPSAAVPAAAPHPNGVNGVAASNDSRPSVDLNIVFATGSAELSPAATRLLDDLGRALSDPVMENSRFLFEGHTDTVGGRDYNQVLSDRRAKAVVAYLSRRFDLPQDRLIAVGRGMDGLLVQTGPGVPEERNRRVHVANIGG